MREWGNRLEASLAYSGRVLDEWVPSDDNEVEDVGAWLPGLPNLWTDGSLVREEVSSVLEVLVKHAHVSGSTWFPSWLVSPGFTSC